MVIGGQSNKEATKLRCEFWQLTGCFGQTSTERVSHAFYRCGVVDAVGAGAKWRVPDCQRANVYRGVNVVHRPKGCPLEDELRRSIEGDEVIRGMNPTRRAKPFCP